VAMVSCQMRLFIWASLQGTWTLAAGTSGDPGTSGARLEVQVEPLVVSQLLRSEAPSKTTTGRRSWPWAGGGAEKSDTVVFVAPEGSLASGADKSDTVVYVAPGGNTHRLGPPAVAFQRFIVDNYNDGDHMTTASTTIPVDTQALDSTFLLKEDEMEQKQEKAEQEEKDEEEEDPMQNIELLPPLPILVNHSAGEHCLKLLNELRAINATLVNVLNFSKAKLHELKHKLFGRLNLTRLHLRMIRSNLTARLSQTKVALKAVAAKLLGKVAVFKNQLEDYKARWRKKKAKLSARLKSTRAKLRKLGVKMRDVMLILGSKAKSLRDKLVMVGSILKPTFKRLGKKVKTWWKTKVIPKWQQLTKKWREARKRRREKWKRAREKASNAWKVLQAKSQHFRKPDWLR